MTTAGRQPGADLLIQAARAAAGSERAELCSILVEADDARCVPLLAELARSPQPELRWRATIALALLGRAPAAIARMSAPLLPLLSDSERRVATAAAVAVLGLGADPSEGKPRAQAGFRGARGSVGGDRA
jgi:HEAT repeat protein